MVENNNKIIVIDGLIGAGKTTLIEKLKEKYKNIIFVKEPVEKFMEYKQYNPLKLSYEDKRNCSISQLHITNCLLDHFKNIFQNNENKIIVTERGLLSPKIFTYLYRKYGYITDFEYDFINDYGEEKIKNIFGDKFPIDGIFYIDIPIDKALERIKKRNRDGEDKIDLEYLQNLDDIFKLTLSENEYKFPIKIVKYNNPHLIEKFIEFYNKFID